MEPLTFWNRDSATPDESGSIPGDGVMAKGIGGWQNQLYYGDNLEVLRSKKIPSESVALCYIDPPFNSKRNYNQIYNNYGMEDRAQAQAFVDTWKWDDWAIIGFQDILENSEGRFQPRLVDLVKGLQPVLGQGSLLAYLVHMSLRITEIHRVLKPNGSFYLHCDPTSSHYLKLILDAVFCSQGGNFNNEIIWRRTGSHNSAKRYGPIHDTIFFYVKDAKDYTWNKFYRPYLLGYVNGYFNKTDEKGAYRSQTLTGSGTRNGVSGQVWNGYNVTAKGRHWAFPGALAEELGIEDMEQHEKLDYIAAEGLLTPDVDGLPEYRQYLHSSKGVQLQDIWSYQPYTNGCLYNTSEPIDGDVKWLEKRATGKKGEKIGYPTQKPMGLLARIIRASTNEGDIVLDAYCGCGTTVTVAQALRRKWIGIDITYQSISLILKRLEETFGEQELGKIKTDGIPKDMASAVALAKRDDDRLRKEFEKWAVLTYSRNRAVINEKKGADAGVDGTAYFKIGKKDNAKIIFQVKSGGVDRSDVATLRGDMGREKAAMAVLITLEKPTKPMLDEARSAGKFKHEDMARDYDAISIVPVIDIIENGRTLDIPMSLEGAGPFRPNSGQ